MDDPRTRIKNYKLFWNALSGSEQATFTRLIKSVCPHPQDLFLRKPEDVAGDFKKAAEKTDIPQALFGKFMEVFMPMVPIMWSAHEATYDTLFWAKVVPGILQNDWLVLAKVAARDLKAATDIIYAAAVKEDKRFFIDLGKCLSGERSSDTHDKIDAIIANLMVLKPSITAADAVIELRKVGYHISQENFRMRKKRLKDAYDTALREADQLPEA